MTMSKESKIVIIGMGYLMEYIAPCYQALLGENLSKNAMAVTADPNAVDVKQKATGVPVLLNDNEKALREINPDIIFFAPPPSLAPGLTEDVLAPYYREVRERNGELPVLFAFPPNPEGKFYMEKLGADIKVVNILPNMIREIAGHPTAEAGFNVVTLPERHNWTEEEQDGIRSFWKPLGQVVFLNPQEVKTSLAVSCSNQMISEILMDMQQAVKDTEAGVAVSDLAQASRAYLLGKLGYNPPAPVESRTDAVSGRLLEAVKKVTYHAYQGTMKFMLEKGFDPEKAQEIQRMNYDLNLRKLQLMEREDFRRTTRSHATRGGVLECACISYSQKWQNNVRDHFAEYPAWTPDADWAEALEAGFIDMSQDVYDHLGRLSAAKEYKKCQIEHHAVLYALLVKEAVEQAGEEGRRAMRQATAEYGQERGRRMRQNAIDRGDRADTLAYLAYGEWSCAPGLMIVDEIEGSDQYMTQVSRCEWCQSWRKHGLMDYGKAYCENVDANIARGYDPEFDLGVYKLMSAGDERCEFDYRFHMTEEKREELAAMKARIGTSAQRDFDYHTAHLYFTCRRVLEEKLGKEKGDDIAGAALFDFTRRFGNGCTNSVMEFENCDFTKNK